MEGISGALTARCVRGEKTPRVDADRKRDRASLSAAGERVRGQPPPSSPLPRCSAFPPVVWWLLSDHGRCNLHLEVVAELPQFLCCARVLEEDSIDFQCINFAGTVAIDGFPDTSDELTQLRVVVVRDHRARRPSFRLAGHKSEVTHGLVPRSGKARKLGRYALNAATDPGERSRPQRGRSSYPPLLELLDRCDQLRDFSSGV